MLSFQERIFTKSHTGFNNLRHVNLNLFIAGDEKDTNWVVGLVNLLELAPVLEELELHVSY